jgi:drug/metabolite transporter (DMT)-like permease
VIPCQECPVLARCDIPPARGFAVGLALPSGLFVRSGYPDTGATPTVSDNRLVIALVLSLLAALGYGVADFVGGLAARRTAAVLSVVMVSYPVGLLGMLAIEPLLGGSPTATSLVIGAISGVISAAAILWFYAALAAGPMSVVSPVTSLLVAGLPLAYGMLTGEHPGVIALVGAAIALIAVVLVSRQEHSAVDEGTPVRFTARVAWLTAGTGIAFGVYFILLDKVGTSTGLWPLIISRAVSSAVVLVAGLIRRQRLLPAGVPRRLALTAGVLDVLGNGAFLYALHVGLLSIVSVVTSLYPAATVVLARVVLGERTGWIQRIGLVLAAAAVVMIASGSAPG